MDTVFARLANAFSARPCTADATEGLWLLWKPSQSLCQWQQLISPAANGGFKGLAKSPKTEARNKSLETFDGYHGTQLWHLWLKVVLKGCQAQMMQFEAPTEKCEFWRLPWEGHVQYQVCPASSPVTQTKPKPSGPKAASSEAANSSASRSNETDDRGKHRKHTDFRCQEVRKAKKDQKGRSRDYLTILPFPNVPAAPESFSSSLQEPGSGSHVRSTQGTSIKKVSWFVSFC